MKHKPILLFPLLATALCADGQNMDWLCHPGEYSEVSYLGNDLFKVRDNLGKWGIIKADGKVTIDIRYDSITPFVENKALLLDRDGKRISGIINDKGELVKDVSAMEYNTTRYPHYKEGRLPFENKYGRQGYLNESGNIAIDPVYYYAAPFQNGIAAVQFGPGFKNDEGYYGLINKGGSSAIYSDDRYDFLSSPVSGYVIGITGSRKGANSLRLLQIEDAKLKKKKTLEDGMIIEVSDDGYSINCQKGHHYYIDNQWRVYGSDSKHKLPEITETPQPFHIETSKILGKSEVEGGIRITYLGNPIVNNVFPDVSTVDNYAIVHSRDGKVGVLRLNKSAAVDIKAPAAPVVFHHNHPVEVLLDVDLKAVNPDKLHWYRNDTGYLTHSSLEYNDGKYRLRIPYYKPNSNPDEPVREDVDIAFTYDGLDWMHHTLVLESVHQSTGRFDVSLTGGRVADANGRCSLNINIKSLNGPAEGSVTITPGDKTERFNGETLRIPISVSVPDNASKECSFTITIEEDGCPSYSTTVSTTVQGHKPDKRGQMTVELEELL